MTNKRLRKELVEGMQALTDIKAVDAVTMKNFKEDLLSPTPQYSPKEIKAIRDSFGLSQSVFAALMNVSASTVQKWETGAKSPSSPAFKLLDIVKKNGVKILIGD